MIYNDEPKIKVYKRRWLILILFALNGFANGLMFTCITSINAIICRYYGIQPSFVNWAANSFLIVYVFSGLPAAYCINYFGLRTLVLIGASLDLLCAFLHFIGTDETGIYFVMAGQFAAAFAVPVTMQIPARLSSVWFPEEEHAKATSIAMLLNIFGTAIGFMQPSCMVPDSFNFDDIHNGLYDMSLSHLVFLSLCLILLYLFYEEKPPHPPSYSSYYANAAVETHNMIDSLKTLFSNKNFMFLAQAFGLYFGGSLFFLTCLNQMTIHIASGMDVGWIGFLGNIVSMVGILLFGVIADKTRAFQRCSVFLTFGTSICWIYYSYVLLYGKSLLQLYLSYGCLSFFGVPFFSLCIEYVSEITYPISEGISSAVIFITANLYGFVMIVCLGSLIKDQIQLVCYIMLGIYLLAFILVCLCKQTLKRFNTEMHHGPIPFVKSKNLADKDF